MLFYLQAFFTPHAFVCVNVRVRLPLLCFPFSLLCFPSHLLVWDVSRFDTSLLMWTSILLGVTGALRLWLSGAGLQTDPFTLLRSAFEYYWVSTLLFPVSHRLDCYSFQSSPCAPFALSFPPSIPSFYYYFVLNFPFAPFLTPVPLLFIYFFSCVAKEKEWENSSQQIEQLS